jgi:hypothetical protein
MHSRDAYCNFEMKQIFPVFFLLGAFSLVHGAVGISHVSAAGSNTFHVLQTFDGSDFTGFSFSFVSGNSYQYAGSFIDEGLDLFRVFEGDVFTPAAIFGNGLQEFVAGNNFVLPAEFFVGLETPSIEATFATLSPAYGWAKIGNSNGVLTLLDHAIDYSGNGLIVGTTTVVPEPGSMSLLAFTAGGLLIRRKR